MLLIGYFEWIGAQRALAWRCADSLSLREFLGLEPGASAPDHWSLSKVRQCLPEAVHAAVFALVLVVARAQGLLSGKTIAVDATTLEANAALRSMVHRVSGEEWQHYVRRLAEESGLDNPSAAEVQRFDKERKDKKVSKREWQSPSDPDSRITKMKDGRTRFAYKLEHAIDVDSDLLVATQIYDADEGDSATLLRTVAAARTHLTGGGCTHPIEEVVGDKGYHKAATLMVLREELHLRTYIPDPMRGQRRVWTDKPAG